MSLNGTQDGRPVRVALDTMGGDYAPVATIKGAIQALRSVNAELLLVGDPDAVRTELAKYDVSGLPVTLVPSEGRIGDDEHPVQAMRQKPNASVVVATQLVKQGQADVMVSIGSTGASMASAVLSLGLMEGLERPCLGGPFLGLAPNTVLVDIGSNLDCRPGLLLSFAVLGATFAHTYMGIENPRIGLLSVGAEEAKGNRQIREAYPLFKESNLNFVGNVEGMDFFTDKADVIVCDGFVGNILMKFTEGLGATLASYLKNILSDKLPSEELAPLAAKVWEVNNLPKRVGGPLFGVNGTVIVGHGASGPEGVVGAIDTARRCIEIGLVENMRIELEVTETARAAA